MSSQSNGYVRLGQCQRCQSREIISHSGYKHLCSRCDPALWTTITKEQKSRYMNDGSVHGKKVKINAKSFDNRANIVKNVV